MAIKTKRQQMKKGSSTVQSLWISELREMPLLQSLCIESFLKNNTQYHLYTYDKVEGLPDGVVLLDANTIIQEDFIFKDRFNSYATFADWFRVKLLYETGGWWVDTDIVCLKEFTTDEEYVFATELSMGSPVICNCVMKAPPQSPMLNAVLLTIEQNLTSRNSKDISWREIGAIALTDGIFDFSLLEYTVVPEVFCPIEYRDYSCIDAEDAIVVSTGTYGIHLWNQMRKWNHMKPSALIDLNSLLSKFVVR